MANNNKSLTKKDWKTTTSALDVAKYLLSLDPESKYFNKKHGNRRLNTMLHICQMLYCAKYGKPLFYEPMHAVSPNFWKDKEEQAKFIKNHEIKDS